MPLLWLSLLFMLGVWLASLIGGSVWLWLAGALVLLAYYWLMKRGTSGFRWLHIDNKKIPVHPILMIFALLLGGFRYLQSRPVINEQTLAYYNDVGRIQIAGKIIRPADPLDAAILLDVDVSEVVKINDVTIHMPVKGRCLVRVLPGTEFHYGDEVVFSGYLQTPPEGEEFSYRDYLARKGIYSYILYGTLEELNRADRANVFSLLYAFRERAYETINGMLSQPEAGLLSGILIGMERDIPQYVEDDFRVTGTTHIVAISGFNIALVAGLLTILLDKMIGKKLAPLGVIGGIFLYTLLVGAQAAVVRAAIMGSISLLGRQIGRRGAGLNTLLLTAALMTWQNPLILGDVGFQLSFSATMGLVLFASHWQEGLTQLIAKRISEQAAEKLSAPISEYFLFTIAAQITTLPVILYHFGQFSVSSFLANPLILPAQPLIMILGGPVVLLGMIWLPIGQFLSWLVWPFLYYTIHMVGWVADMPGGVIPVQVSMGIAAVLILMLILIVMLIREKHAKLAIIMRPVIVVLVLVLANSFLWRELFREADGNLHLSIYPAGDCTVVLMESPGGQRLMTNGGNEASTLSSELGSLLPMTHRNIDILLIPQDRAACMSAVPKLMERFKVNQIITAPVMSSSRNLTAIDAAAVSQGIQEVIYDDVLEIAFQDEVMVKLFPSQTAESVTQIIEWKAFSALLAWEGNMPCTMIEQEQGMYSLYLDGRKEAKPLGDECENVSALVQAIELPLGQSDVDIINLTQYRKLTITTDGEQVWIDGVRP
ncbi:MAG: ComEC family competence protein [Anaerolineaceae bacterium]|nr:ComEC family competence protein [Anaerolineaceae bacterium]